VQDERPNRERNEDALREEIDRFEDLIRKLSHIPIEEVREERRRWEREQEEKREREKPAE
jgi:hypothetical protein